MLALLRSRPLALLAGLWFLVAGREPPFPHPCEMGTAGTPGAMVGAGADASAAHAHHHDAPAPTPAECECVDDCCVSVVVSGAPVAALVVLPPVLRDEPRCIAVVARATDAAPRLLPYANGPPELS